MSSRIAQWAELINGKLDELSAEAAAPSRIVEAMRYSLLSGGKRLRGSLALAANAMLGGDTGEALAVACAIEMIHCFSLIHDDLPAMDDDDTRRGKPSNHIAYGEALALLAGDALLSLAFERMIENARRYPDRLAYHLAAMDRVASASGMRGMAGGQCLDLAGIDGGAPGARARLKELHALKTGALISASVSSGLILAGASPEQLDAGERFGAALGVAFQIRDDILDVTGDPAALGKRVGMDKGKVTWVTLHGLEGSEFACGEYLGEAERALEIFGGNACDLRDLLERQKDRCI